MEEKQRIISIEKLHRRLHLQEGFVSEGCVVYRSSSCEYYLR